MRALTNNIEKVFVAGDWHGNEAAAVWSIKQAARKGVNTILHTGDFGIWPGQRGENFLKVVEKSLLENDVELYFVDGNHEDFPQLLALPLNAEGVRKVRENLYHLPRGFRWTWQGLTFLALGGATSVDRPHRVEFFSWWKEESLTLKDVYTAANGGPADVLITHDAPAGVHIPGLHNNWDASELARARRHQELLLQVVESVQPTHLFHGHFHVRYTDELTLSSGARVEVNGLDCDGSGWDALLEVDLEILAAESLARR